MIIATIGGHSALEICLGAKKEGFKTLVLVQKGREQTYTKYFSNLVDEFIILNNFSELTDTKTSSRLQKKKCILIPHRYIQVYCDREKFENNFTIPVFGNKFLLKYEDREGDFNQYQILKKAGVPFPKQFNTPKDIDRLVLVKVNEKDRSYERAFFFAKTEKEFDKKSEELIDSGKITRDSLKNAIIEEYLIGAQVNFNFFYSPLNSKLELLGTDIRRQTNIDGFIRIPFREQQQIQEINPTYIEAGHIAVTVKESLLEQAFILAEKLLMGARKIVSPGIIGPFALQTAIIPGPPQERIVVYDISLRMPGSPGTSFTPYSQYHFGESISFGQRIAREIGKALQNKMISKIVS